jgi:hypothetical protein
MFLWFSHLFSGCYFLVALVLFVLVVALVPIVSRYTLFHALVFLLSMVITLGRKDFPRCKGHRSGKKNTIKKTQHKSWEAEK